jgi:hypothetical protein
MSNLTTLELSKDQSIVSIGPSYRLVDFFPLSGGTGDGFCLSLFRWSDVYEYLQKFDLTAAGGRLGPVGVPGLLLAGGINFYGNQVGFGCDTVVNYEIVLANGSIVEANETSYPDLFWALKGGSSNFGIVTRFDLETIKSRKVWAGAHTVSAEYIDQFLAVCYAEVLGCMIGH